METNVHFAEIRVMPKNQWQGKLVFHLTYAPVTPNVELVGKEAGEIGFVQATGTDNSEGQAVKVSLGPAAKVTPEALRRVGAAIVRWLQKHEIGQAAVDLTNLPNLDIKNPEFLLAEGLHLGAYQFDTFKSKKGDATPVEITFLGSQDTIDSIKNQVGEAQKLTLAVNLAREWDHLPANVINPITLADLAQQVASQNNLKFTVLDDRQLADMGAGAIVAVGKGSQAPSRMIILEYPGRGVSSESKPVILVGKAITFDTGGYSLKTVEGIQGMKYDKSGGLVVLATLRAAAQLKLNTPLVGVICAAENMISGESYRPDDIITSLSGKTIEIISTDAEGRLVLADGLTYAQKHYQPATIIDLATLTGGMVVALGHVRAGIMSNDDHLAEQLISAGEKSHERLWRMPLDEDYFTNIKGDEADIKNSGGREGAPIFGGIFLEQFIEDNVPWAHIDIAGTAHQSKELPYSPKGATGFGVRLLIEYLIALEST